MLDIKGLRRELTEAGIFEKCEGRTWAKLGFLFGVLALCIAGHILAPLWVSVLMTPVTALVSVTIAMLGHEGGHLALSNTRWRNDLMLHLAFPAFGGLGALYWKWKHNVKHHAHPNIAEQDPDLGLWPMASTALEYRKSSPNRQFFQRNFQSFMFWPLTFFLAFSMRAATLQYMWSYVRERGVDRKWMLDAVSLMIHVIAWLIIPTYFLGPWAVAFYIAHWAIGGAMLAAIFAPAHMGMPILTDHNDKWRLQLETSRNLRMPAWMGWFFIGLDYQIEHHLFPRIPHQKMSMAAPIVRRWAARQGAPYFVVDYFDGLADVSRYMAAAWKLDAQEGDSPEKWGLKGSEWNSAGVWIEPTDGKVSWWKQPIFPNLPGPSAATATDP